MTNVITAMKPIFFRTISMFTFLVIAGWFLNVTLALGQEHQVRGVVTDVESEEPLIGVNIRVKDTDIGTATNHIGEFTLTANSPDDVLVFSYLGYQTKEVPIEGREELEVELTSEGLVGEEVVMVGYGVQRQRDVTGAVSSIDASRVRNMPTMSADQVLQGAAPGVQVRPSSGAPGASSVIRIRGVGTLNDASPLFVVDGMTVDNIDFLNPQDIEDINVLKDASATAIYGARGANGVIMISTRRSQIDRPTEIDVNVYRGWQEIARQIPLANAHEYAVLSNELAENEGRSPVFDDPNEFGEGTDWQDVAYRVAPVQSYQVAASGGTMNTAFRVSANYTRQDGIVRDNHLERINLRINNDYYLSDALRFGHNIGMVHQFQDPNAGVIGNAYRADPTVSPFDEDGNFNSTTARAPVGNLEADLHYHNSEQMQQRLFGNAYLDYTFLDNFEIRTDLGIDATRSEGKNFSPEYFVDTIQQSEENSLSVNTGFNYNILWENTLRYQNQFEGHRFDALLGHTIEEFKSESLGGSRIGMIGDIRELWYLNAGETEGQQVNNSSFDWGMESYIGRINYSYLDRYQLTATMRRDGSSRFGVENRYGWFPSFALGWVASDEPFIDNLNVFDHLRFRGSWGVTGNDKIGSYPGRPTVTGNINAVFGEDEDIFFGSTITTLANPQVGWEETTQLNAGVEFTLLGERLNAMVEYYDRVTDGILVQVPIPDYVGAGEPFVNAAEVKNYGFDFSLSWQEAGDAGFFYRVELLGSTINNEVLSLGEGREDIFGGGVGVGGMLATRTEVGESIGYFYGYEVDGVFQNEEELENYPTRGGEQPGDLRFRDLTGDGEITTDDRTKIGSPIPDLTFGANFSIGYRGFDLNANFAGQYGNEIYNAKQQARFGTPNWERTALDRWTGENTSDTHPRLTDGGHNFEVSDRFIEDGSYLKLQHIEFGYTLDGGLADRLNLSELRIYTSASNLFTLTEYSGYTPEIASGSVISDGIDSAPYPVSRTVTVGINTTF